MLQNIPSQTINLANAIQQPRPVRHHLQTIEDVNNCSQMRRFNDTQKLMVQPKFQYLKKALTVPLTDEGMRKFNEIKENRLFNKKPRDFEQCTIMEDDLQEMMRELNL